MMDTEQLVAPQSTRAPLPPGKMAQAALERPGKWTLVESDAPLPELGQIRVRLEGCGVCASGIPVWEGREWFDYPMLPGALGHEGWGIVDAVGVPNRPWGPRVGDRVAFLADGAYSTHICLAPEQVLRLPAALAGQPFPAEPVGCAINVFRRSGIQAGMTVAIVGMGFLGCLLLQLARSAGASVVCFSARSWSRKVAEGLGAEKTFALGEHWEAPEALQALSMEGFDCVLEATGAQRGLDFASALVGVRGRLIIAGYHQDGPRQINLQQWNWKGIDVINAHERDPKQYASGMRKGIDLAAAGRLSVEPLLTHRYPLSEIDAAYHDLIERPDGFMKAWIDLKEPYA